MGHFVLFLRAIYLGNFRHSEDSDIFKWVVLGRSRFLGVLRAVGSSAECKLEESGAWVDQRWRGFERGLTVRAILRRSEVRSGHC